jgi:hypothetical protein
VYDIFSEKWTRIDRELYTLALNPKTPNLVPSRLRPPRNYTGDAHTTPMPTRLTGNLIVGAQEVEKHFNQSIKSHLCQHPVCNGDVVFDPASYRKWGAAFSCKLKCTANCGYMSPELDFYKKVDKVDVGRKSAKINIQLQVALSKLPIGNSSLRKLLLACDINAPCPSAMQRLSNKIGDDMIEFNLTQLETNRATIAACVKLRDWEGTQEGIVAQADTCYNNPIKGRSFYCPGTQAWCPLYSSEPGLELPVAFNTRSKLCSCVVGHHGPKCKQDYPLERPMGNVEFDFGELMGADLTGNGTVLIVRELVTDGDAHTFRGLNKAMTENGITTSSVKGDCTRHLTKTIGRNLCRANLSTMGLAGTTIKDRTQNKRMLAAFIEKRCSWEFQRAYKKSKGDVEKTKILCTNIQRGVFACISGDTNTCRRLSLVCAAHKKKHDPKVSISRKWYYRGWQCYRRPTA